MVSRYRVEDRLKVNGCETLLIALDLNGNGFFDQRDFSGGTSIGLDRTGMDRLGERMNGSRASR